MTEPVFYKKNFLAHHFAVLRQEYLLKEKKRLELFLIMEFFTQLLWNGLVNGALIALVALGLTLIYGIAGFIHFAHGEMVALGAYGFMVLYKIWGWPLIPAVAGTLFLTLILGLILEYIFFRPIRNRDPMTPLVVSIGLGMGLQALLLLFFGSQILSISNETFKSLKFFNDSVFVTPNQILALISALSLMVLLNVFLKKSYVGKMIRAVSSNKSIAELFGLSSDVAMRWVFGIGSLLAALSGIFVGFEQNLEPTMGLLLGIKAFSALILGAVGSVRGAILGSFVIALSESFLVGYNIIPSGYSLAIPFVILILTLLIKPEGLFGKKFVMLRQ